MQIFWGFVIAALIVGAAYRLRLLDRSGAAAALALGTVVFGLGGWSWSVGLVAFFATSSLLTRLLAKRKVGLEEMAAKGGQRDARQVLANGGWAGLAVVGHAFWPGQAWPWIGFCGALGVAATASSTRLVVLITKFGEIRYKMPKSTTKAMMM